MLQDSKIPGCIRFSKILFGIKWNNHLNVSNVTEEDDIYLYTIYTTLITRYTRCVFDQREWRIGSFETKEKFKGGNLVGGCRMS